MSMIQSRLEWYRSKYYYLRVQKKNRKWRKKVSFSKMAFSREGNLLHRKSQVMNEPYFTYSNQVPSLKKNLMIRSRLEWYQLKSSNLWISKEKEVCRNMYQRNIDYVYRGKS